MRIAISVAVILLFAGCSTTTRLPPAPEGGQGAAIARAAMQLVGTPYEFGGADEHGFDCSGLAVYAHATVGLDIPRTARDQDRAARPVSLRDLRPGDLVFFRISAREVNRGAIEGQRSVVDHVGIYTGDGRFVHAPRRGEVVSYASLNDSYFRNRFVRAGRFWRPP